MVLFSIWLVGLDWQKQRFDGNKGFKQIELKIHVRYVLNSYSEFNGLLMIKNQGEVLSLKFTFIFIL